MGRILNLIFMFGCLVTGVCAWSFDIPFTESRFILFEEDNFVGIEDRVVDGNFEVNLNDSNLGLGLEIVEVPVEGVSLDDFSKYGFNFSFLSDYEGEVFEVRTNVRVVKVVLRNMSFFSAYELDSDYEILIGSELEVLELVEAYNVNGTLPSIFEIEDLVDMPFGLKTDLAMNLLR